MSRRGTGVAFDLRDEGAARNADARESALSAPEQDYVRTRGVRLRER